MTASDILGLVAAIGTPLAVVIYVLLLPEKAQLIAGWLWSGIAKVFGRADRRAVALRVQGHINGSTKHVFESLPGGLVEGSLKLRWNNAEEATALLRDGDVVVFMRRSHHHEENVAHALMVYLPKAILPRARRYLDAATMAAVDLTVAKIVLGRTPAGQGVLEVFYEQHLDPACDDDEALRQKVTQMDEVDLHGWLLRVLLPEYRRLGNQLHPSMPDVRSRADAEAFARWLHRLASAPPGDFSTALTYEGPYFRVALIFVALPKTLAEKGSEPYRKRAKTLIYSGRYDAVYLIARDRNMWAVREIVSKLHSDGRIASTSCLEFRLRPDFAKRRLKRDRSVVACLEAHTGHPADELLAEEADEFQIERFKPGHETDVVGRSRISDPAASEPVPPAGEAASRA